MEDEKIDYCALYNTIGRIKTTKEREPKIRSSSGGRIMGRIEKEPKQITKGMNSYIEEMLGYVRTGETKQVKTLALDKGTRLEDDAIKLLSEVDKQPYKKNEVRLDTEFFTGECDLFIHWAIEGFGERHIKDIKNAYKVSKFEGLTKPSKTYEWQGRIYMHLWNVDKFELCYFFLDADEKILNSERSYLDLQYRKKYGVKWRLNKALMRNFLHEWEGLKMELIAPTEWNNEDRVKRWTIERD